MTFNRNKTLKEIEQKILYLKYNRKPFLRKAFYRDWVYSFGINRPKKAFRLNFK